MDRRKRYRQTVALMSMLSETKTIDNVDIAAFDGNGENLLSLIVGIDPMQDLHGYDTPWPAGGGANKLPVAVATVMQDGLTYAATEDGKIKVTGTADVQNSIVIQLPNTVTIANGDYLHFRNVATSSGSIYLKFSDGTVRQPGFTSANRIFDLSASVGKTLVTIGISYELGAEMNVEYQPSIENTSSVTTYSPYSNLCPISGWTDCDISHSGADTSDPTIYTIAFPSEAGTVYGGTLDVVRKKMTVNRENIPSYNGETLSGEWISDRDVYSVGGTPTIGAQVVYQLDSPIVYDLADAPVIQTYEGENNIWADTGKIIFLEYEA